MNPNKAFQREKVVREARSWIGTPYHHQASVKGAGCDCLGLVRGVWRAIYGPEPKEMPPYTRDWAETRGRETLAEAGARYLRQVQLSEIRPGDVLLFGLHERVPAKHCAILTAPDRMVHSCELHPVAEVSFSKWRAHRLRYAFAFPDLTD